MKRADPIAVSKTIGYFLRHDPAAGGLTLDENGWTSFEALAGALHAKFGVSAEEIREIVASDPKRRYAVDGDRIRASQGHSVEVDLALSAVTPPDVLYHGTVERFLESILRQGLLKGERTHVHLSSDIDAALVVARRRRGSHPIVLKIGSSAMHAAGIAFYRSDNGVWLVEAVPAQFVSVHDL